MKYIVFTIAFLIILFSCARTHYISIDVRKAAPITLAPTTKRIVIVDNSFISKKADSIYEASNVRSITKQMIDSIRPVLINSMARYMNEENIYDSVEVYPFYPKPLYLYKEASGIELPLTKEEIIDICTRTGTDALISFDLIEITARITQISKISMQGRIDTDVSAIIRTYNYKGDSLSIPMIRKYSFSRYINLNDDISTLFNHVEKSGENAADMLTNLFIPEWEYQGRPYYTYFPNPTYLSILLKDKEEWGKTAIKWEKEYYKKKNWKKKAKYASNAALAYEYMDEIDSSMKWINRAYDALPVNNKSDFAIQIREYRDTLIQRTKEAPLLKRQLKIEDKKNTDSIGDNF